MSSSVLIADDARGRARRLGEAVAARGFATSFAENGAIALEVALTDVPDVVLTPVDLPLIDAARLAEILRANPRTQDVRFLFLGRDAGGLRGYFDEVLPPSADPEEIAMRIEAMLAHRERIDAVDREASTDHEVQGKLSQIPLTDLLQLFHMNRRTGTLELRRPQPAGREERGSITLRDGNAIQAMAGAVDGEKALYRLLAWHDGSFAFNPNRVSMTPRILTPTRALLLEGVRQLDEWDRMSGNLPALGAQVVLSVEKADLPNAVHPVTQEVLLLLEIYDEVREVVDHCSYPDYQVLRTIQTLADRGIVTLGREPDRPAPGSLDSLFDSGQVRRLRDWLESGRPRGAPIRDPKLLVASPDPGAMRDFVRLLSGLPGMFLTPQVQRGDLDPESAVPLGRLVVDGELGIQWIHVPVRPDAAPIWPVVGYRALGSLLLMSAPLDAAEERIAPLRAVLQRLPRARIFHMLLLGKGERSAAEEVREKLSLLDDASLFVMQLEGNKDAGALLRTMLARVMP